MEGTVEYQKSTLFGLGRGGFERVFEAQLFKFEVSGRKIMFQIHYDKRQRMHLKEVAT